MKLSKLFLRWAGILSVMMAFSISAWGDNASNDNCLNAELNPSFSNLSTLTTGNISGQLTASSDEQDYYKITIASAGTLEINASSTQTFDFSIGKSCSGTTCGTDIYTNGNTNTASHHSGVFSVVAGDTIYLKLSRNNRTLTYNLSINYQPPPKIGWEQITYQTSENLALVYGESSQMPMRITIDHAVDYPISVSFATHNGTAIGDSDYRISNGTVTIPAGQTAVTIYMDIFHDETIELTENFTVTLSNPTGSGNVILKPGFDVATVSIMEQSTAPMCYSDDFNTGTAIGNNWRVLQNQGITPGYVNGKMRLTDRKSVV